MEIIISKEHGFQSVSTLVVKKKKVQKEQLTLSEDHQSTQEVMS